MNDFMEELQKIRSGFFGRMRLLFILDMITIFSIFYAIFIVFQVEFFLNKSSLYLPIPINLIPPVMALIIAVIGSLSLHKKDRKINVILLIENKYPELREKLRTAYDNRDETNIIVDSLKHHVSDAINIVSPSQLLAKRKILSKILITSIFIVGAFTIASNPEVYGIPPDTLTNISSTITGKVGVGINETIEVVGRPEEFEKVGVKGGGDIFGKPKIASIEGKNIDLTLYSGMGTGFEVRDVSETMYQFRRTVGDFPVEPLAANVSDGGYGILMKKTETEKELINKYAVERSKI